MADSEDIQTQGGDDSVDNEPLVPAVTEHEKQLGNLAKHEFERKQYVSCAREMDKLLQTRNVDPKVMHNKFVLDFYQSGLRMTDEFMNNMTRVCDMLQIRMSSVDSLEDLDQSVIYYNQVIVLYHTKRYGEALTIAEKLYTLLEPLSLDEALSKKVMCMLIELYLQTSQPSKAIAIINSLEKAVLGGKREGSEDNSDQSAVPDSLLDEWKIKINLYKVQGLLQSRSLKHCKRELRNLTNNPNDMTPTYMKANYEFVRGNLQKSMRILNSVQPTNNPRRLTDASSVMYYNNLACIHMMLHKHNLGAFYFKKALQENEMMNKELKLDTLSKMYNDHSVSGKPLYILPMSRHYELLYNTGIQLLHCGKPAPAFDCLIEAVKVYSSNPRLWLRLAECCIMTHQKHNDDDRSLDKRMQVVDSIVGTSVHRKFVLGNGKGDFRPCTESAAMPGHTLEFAALCLSNALLILDKAEGKMHEEGGERKEETVLVPAPPSSPMKRDEVLHLRCSILANSAYVALQLRDCTSALTYAEKLIDCPGLTPALRYLSHMYMAEAQVYLDNIAEAIDNLNLDYASDVSTSLPTVEQEKDSEPNEVQGSMYPWIPSDPIKAGAFMYYNLTVCYAMRGEFDKAMKSLSKCTTVIGTPLPVQVYFMRLYLDLIEGRRAYAQAILKEHFGHATPNLRPPA